MSEKGTTYGKGQNTLEGLFENDTYADERKTNRFYPFSNKMEWEVASWLHKLHVSVDLLDQFFKLKYVRSLFK